MNELILEIDQDKATQLIEKLAKFVVERKMAPAAILAIESLKPLNFIGSQLMHTVSPFAEVFFNAASYQEVAALFEKREYVEQLVRRIDELDEEFHREERRLAKERNKQRRAIRKEKRIKLKNKIINIFNKKNQGE